MASASAGLFFGVPRQVTPADAMGCKRVLFSSRWLPTLQRPNVEVGTARCRVAGTVPTAAVADPVYIDVLPVSVPSAMATATGV